MVVIYAENRSFNNLFANFPGVEKPLSALTAADYTQYDRDGTALPALPPVAAWCRNRSRPTTSLIRWTRQRPT